MMIRIPKNKFNYLDRVKVTKGFYRGHVGTIREHEYANDWFNIQTGKVTKDYRYHIFFKLDHAYFYEHELEKVLNEVSVIDDKWQTPELKPRTVEEKK